MDNEQNYRNEEAPGSAPHSREDQVQFWKKKWLREQRFMIILGLAATPFIVYLVYSRKLIELSPFGWVIVLLLFFAIDLLYYKRRMDDYVMAHMANKTDKDHDPDDDRFYDSGSERR